jgi:4,4'-diapolycopenoate synthase
MSPLEADGIVARAREAQSVWAALSISQRCSILGRLRRAIALECEPIAHLIASETTKPVLDALSGDVLVTLEIMRYYETHAAEILRPRKVGKPSFFFRGASFELHLEAHGVALIFGPSNYPLQLSMVPAITALIAGNAVVLKCSERTPQTAALIERLCAEAGLAPNLVQVLSDGPEESAALIDARPDIIFFTGSSRHGQMVAERAAKYLIPTILELGGKDPALVFADCQLGRAVEGVTYGAFSNGGRVCVGIKRVYVEASIYKDFVTRIRDRMAALRVGTDADADLCPVTGAGAAVLRAQVDDALARGATLHYPQERDVAGSVPTLLADVPAEARILSEECFGPVLCIAPFSDEEDALRLANENAFALSASIWTGNRTRARRVAARISAGSCAVNDVIRVIANPHAPFGGNRLSGYGRYHGPEGIRTFSRLKTIMLADDRREREINWFPFTVRTRRQLAGLLRFRHGHTGIAARLIRLVMPMLLLAVCGTIMIAQSKSETHLTVNVLLTDDAHGELAYLVFDSPSGFPGDRDKAIRHGFLEIPSGAKQMRIDTDLPPSTYAVAVYEDLNSNHKLDHNFLGIPREPVGASNNPHGRFGPPHFEECSFRMDATPKNITITMVRGL